MTKPRAPRGESIVVEVRAHPRSSRDEILGFRDDALHVRIKAPPREGEANQHLIGILAEVLGIPQSRIEILTGHKGRRKRVRVSDPPAEALKILSQAQRVKV